MKKTMISTLAAIFLAGISMAFAAAGITGDYVEVRSADVYTGPCFAMSQVDLEGKQAILAWHVRKGSWKGVDLSGLSVVAVVDANATLGDPYHSPYPAKSVLIVDDQASAAQGQALQGLAHAEAGKLLSHIVGVEAAPIRLAVGEGENHGSVNLQAGRLVSVRTRSLCAGDHICGNEEIYYPPLVSTSHAMPAFTLEDAFHGDGLGMDWSRADARSAYVGSFAL